MTIAERRIVPSACPLDCPDACSVDVTVEDGRVVALDGNQVNPLTAGFLCGKVRDFARHMYHADRLLTPLVRRGPKGAGELQPTGWDEALTLVAERMRAARERHGGEAILPFYYGGSNGSLTQGCADARLFRRLGASRLLTTVCAVPTGLAAREMYGAMPGVALDDYVHARLIVLWGVNPQATGIHLVPILKRARAAGTKLVVVDPRRTQLAKGADQHLAPRPGTDVALALGVIRWLFEHGAADEAFLAAQAEGAEALRRRAAPWTLERAAATAGVPVADLEAFARLYAESAPAVIRCGWGLERNRNGGSAVCAVLALPAVGGKLGVRGGGYTMSNSRAWRLPDPIDDPVPPTREVNMNRLGRALLELRDPPIEVLFVFNANPLVTVPEQNRVREGLLREDLFTVVFDQVLTDTARLADVVLPATTFLEHLELRKGYGALVMQLARPAVPPVGEARPNHAVFTELLHRLGLARPDDEEDLEALARRLVGDEERWRRLEATGAIEPVFGAHPVQMVDVLPGTPDGRIHLVPEALDREAPRGLYAFLPDPATERFPLALISPSTELRISSTFGQLHRGEVPLSIHPEDAAPRGLSDGDPVRVHNELGEVLTSARVTEDVRPGTVVLPKGLWLHNTRNGATSNALVSDAPTDVGGGATFNDARVEVERCGR